MIVPVCVRGGGGVVVVVVVVVVTVFNYIDLEKADTLIYLDFRVYSTEEYLIKRFEY